MARYTLVLAISLAAAGAQTTIAHDLADPPPTASDSQAPASVVEELRRLIDAQQRQIDAQAGRLDSLERALRESRLDSAASAATATPAVQPAVAPSAAQQAARTPEMVADVDEDLEGALRIPGTEGRLKITGQVRFTAVHTFNPLGTDDRFVTSSIPVGDARPLGDEARVEYTAVPSRFGLDTRMPYRSTSLRTFIEGDFDGSDTRAFRLRHAFLQTNRILVGQTWSTFTDRDAEPLGIDFEGLNAISLFRQAQLRYTHPLHERLNLAVAVENPAPDLTGAEGVNQTPDLVTQVRWEPSHRVSLIPGGALRRTQHIQGALLLRQLRGQVQGDSSTTVATGAVGGNLSGVLTPLWSEHDRVKFAANVGRGIGKYITDLRAVGGQDAVYNMETGQLEALRVAAGYVGYERHWRPGLISAFTYGIVDVDTRDVQPGTALRRTQRTSINLTWSPVAQVDIGFEYLAGTRVNKDGQSAGANQFQLGWIYRF